MNRDELIEKMCEAAFNDQGLIDWVHCREAGNQSLGLVRERMARALDVVEGEIRTDERAFMKNVCCDVGRRAAIRSAFGAKWECPLHFNGT